MFLGSSYPLRRRPWQRWRPRSAQHGRTEVPRSHGTTRPVDKRISSGHGVSELTIQSQGYVSQQRNLTNTRVNPASLKAKFKRQVFSTRSVHAHKPSCMHQANLGTTGSSLVMTVRPNGISLGCRGGEDLTRVWFSLLPLMPAKARLKHS